MVKIDRWKAVPVEDQILLILLANRGEILNTELYRKLALIYQDFTRESLLDYLFRMEVRGYIFVVPIKKEVSKIEINKQGKFSQTIMKKIKAFSH